MTIPTKPQTKHPRAFEPATLALLVICAAVGSVIGLQIITTLGVTPNTALIGVLVAVALSRVPLAVLRPFRSVHRQNLVQSTISTATFAAANSLLLPIAIPVVLGRPGLVWPMLIGAGLAMLIDFVMLYWLFDSKVFPGSGAWPPGVAAAEAIKAGDEGGKRAALLGAGTAVGLLGSWLGVPMSAFGVAFIGNVVALTMFGVGLLARGYSADLFGVDIAAHYIPHGLMVGAGLVALIQALVVVFRGRRTPEPAESAVERTTYTRDDSTAGRGLARGFVLYVGAAILLAITGGLIGDLGFGELVLWVLYAAVSCIIAEFIVGLSAMHSGWFPSFATSLIFLTIGMLLGFPPIALALLVGFIAAGGPAFADAGYDFKAGWLLRGRGSDPAFELAGRRQQLFAGVIGMAVAGVVVALTYHVYFDRDLFPPIVQVYAKTIQAGADQGLIGKLLLWAVPGAIIQALGGAKRQMGILLATGTLIVNPIAGWTVLAGIVLRVAYRRWKGPEAESQMTIAAAGFIAGDALYGFGNSLVKTKF
ncbi:putative oligopeptide transporter (OPT) family protein [Kribbella sp. VKM Ac-2569]|uniref:OPT/YSL family transporter n=1 Tax=Kribbella sp. VKM Ac-2569 TaxID=2512220 RepID=UPI00102ADA88|nr:OPT/YSL family transporter [Kribbella sp. VKM Ac-2569]RZT13171.1 putative oligopeptide transporter (OPT) family protein [Kribbella sp. VKM Ac-2569]